MNQMISFCLDRKYNSKKLKIKGIDLNPIVLTINHSISDEIDTNITIMI